MDTHESLQIIKGDYLMNSENGPIPFNCLDTLSKQPLTIICERPSTTREKASLPVRKMGEVKFLSFYLSP